MFILQTLNHKYQSHAVGKAEVFVVYMGFTHLEHKEKFEKKS